MRVNGEQIPEAAIQAADLEKAIETCQDMLDVLNTSGSAYLYKHNGGREKLTNIIQCLEIKEAGHA